MPIQRTLLPDGRVLISGEDEWASAQAEEAARKERERLDALEAAAQALAAAEKERERLAQAAKAKAEQSVAVRQAFDELEAERLSKSPFIERALRPKSGPREHAAITDLINQLVEIADYPEAIARHLPDLLAALNASEFNRNEMVRQNGIAKLFAVLPKPTPAEPAWDPDAKPHASSAITTTATTIRTAVPTPPSTRPTTPLTTAVVPSSPSPTTPASTLRERRTFPPSPTVAINHSRQIIGLVLQCLNTLAELGGHPSEKFGRLGSIRQAIFASGGLERLMACLDGYGLNKSSTGNFKGVHIIEFANYERVISLLTCCVRGNATTRRVLLESDSCLSHLVCLLGSGHRATLAVQVGELLCELLTPLPPPHERSREDRDVVLDGEELLEEARNAVLRASVLPALCNLCAIGATEGVRSRRAQTRLSPSPWSLSFASCAMSRPRPRPRHHRLLAN